MQRIKRIKRNLRRSNVSVSFCKNLLPFFIAFSSVSIASPVSSIDGLASWPLGNVRKSGGTSRCLHHVRRRVLGLHRSCAASKHLSFVCVVRCLLPFLFHCHSNSEILRQSRRRAPAAAPSTDSTKPNSCVVLNMDGSIRKSQSYHHQCLFSKRYKYRPSGQLFLIT